MNPTFNLDEIAFIGHRIRRPECVPANARGNLFVADWNVGVNVLAPDSTKALVRARGSEVPVEGIKPNGIALCRDASFPVTRLDDRYSGVFRLMPNGEMSLTLAEAEGVALPPTNSVHVDARVGNGLGPRETFTELGPGDFPDGLDFDEAGGLWIASIVSNRLIRIDPDGRRHVVLDDSDPAYLDRFERDYQSGDLIDRPADTVPSRLLGNISSLAFGGPDRHTVYLGSLQDSRIATFRSPIAGARPAHWAFG